MKQILLMAGAAALAIAGPAVAKPGHGQGHGNSQSYGTHGNVGYGVGGCPPGLAKKGNGCLPPGQAKRRYIVGQRLPTTVVIQPLPPVLVTRLGPAPRGYEYAVVDGDVVKLAVGTRLVVDAITALLN